MQEHQPVDSLWYTRCPLPTASGIAIDAGLLHEAFAQIGIGLRSIEELADNSARQAHFDHGVRNLFRQGGNIPPIWARSQGADTAVVGLSWTPEYQAILARPESGIRMARDLKGARFALPQRPAEKIDYWQAMCLHGYASALALGGLTLEDAALVSLPVTDRYIDAADGSGTRNTALWAGANRARRQQAEVFAFIRGEVDVLYASGALGAQLAAQLGAHEVVELGLHAEPGSGINNQMPNVLTVDRKLAEDRPDVVARYLDALAAGGAWAAAHQPQAKSALAREIGCPEEWIPAAYGPRFYDQLELALDEQLIEALGAQKQFLLQHGFIAHDFPIAEWIVHTPMDLARKQGSSFKEHA